MHVVIIAALLCVVAVLCAIGSHNATVDRLKQTYITKSRSYSHE